MLGSEPEKIWMILRQATRSAKPHEIITILGLKDVRNINKYFILIKIIIISINENFYGWQVTQSKSKNLTFCQKSKNT